MLSNSCFGNHCHIKGKSSQHLEMKLYSLKVFTNIPVSMVLTFSVYFLLVTTKSSLGYMQQRRTGKIFSIMDEKRPRAEFQPCHVTQGRSPFKPFPHLQDKEETICPAYVAHCQDDPRKITFVRGLCKTGVDELSLQRITGSVQ